MTGTGSLILCTALGTGLLACGSGGTSSKNPLDLVPLDDDVSGWAVDKENAGDPTQRAGTASTAKGGENLIALRI
jgi:hypothetical protein